MSVTPLRPGREPPQEPPSDRRAEQALLGALLVDNRAYHRVVGMLRATHFFWAVHARIYHAIGIQVGRGEEASPITLGHYFEQDEALTTLGGSRYLWQLAQCAVTVINAPDYAKAIVDMANAREAMAAAQEMLDALANPKLDQSAADHVARLRAQLDDIVSDTLEVQPISPSSWIGQPTPQREWVVNEWIPLRRATGLYGAPGACKSLLMQSCALRLRLAGIGSGCRCGGADRCCCSVKTTRTRCTIGRIRSIACTSAPTLISATCCACRSSATMPP